MSAFRIQLTLFIGENYSNTIEYIRQEFNPEQYALIKSHVTLCREDELENMNEIISCLNSLNHGKIIVDFGQVVRFSEGKGVILPAIGDSKPFHDLRAYVLDNPRKHEPHITLMHPRNSTCTDAIFNEISTYNFPHKIEFHKISLIKQEVGKPWYILEEFELKAKN